MTLPRAAAALLIAACAICAARPCVAKGLDPATAEEDTRAALREGNDTFCRTPPVPLSARSRKLCPFAADIPNCAGLVAACTGDKPKDESHSALWTSLEPILSFFSQAGIWLLVAAIVFAIGYPFFKVLARARRDRRLSEPLPEAAPAAPDLLPPAPDATLALSPERLLTQAEECARRGDNDRALYAYLQAALRALDERGAIRIERHRTHGEYVRGCTEQTAKEPLREIVREVDRVRFGGSPSTPDAVARAGSRAVSLVRTTLLAIVALAALASCEGANGAQQSSDPGEDGLVLDVMRRQGVVVSRLGGSLATLPIPASKEIAPIIVVDAERTPLEDDSRSHLMRWVEAGGTLVLVGAPANWPKELGAHDEASSSTDVNVNGGVDLLATSTVSDNAETEDDPAPAPRVDHAKLARSAALTWTPEATTLATLSSGQTYAAIRKVGSGWVLGVANDDLFTNAGLARTGNAAALVVLLAYAESAADGEGTTDAPPPFRIARPEDGITPPTNPLTSLFRAGLGLGFVHALIATALLFCAVGIRHARARQSKNPARRAFAEHVEATGALYARTNLGAHALAVYAKYADERLRAKMPRATESPAAFLAARSGVDAATCARVWARATEPDAYGAGGRSSGDEIAVLRQLSNLVAAATRTE